MSASSKRPSQSKRSRPAKTGPTSKKSPPKGKQGRARGEELLKCPVDGCRRPYKTQRGLDRHVERDHPTPPAASGPARLESPSQAVERLLTAVAVDGVIPSKLAVLAATVRELATALEQCDPTDKAKTAKELTARVAELLSGVSVADESDWTDEE